MTDEVTETDKLKEIQKLMEYLGSQVPENMNAFGGFIQSVQKNGKLSLKVKELISIALSISSQCEWCIPYHAKMALQNGATVDEIMEAAMVAVLMYGSPALMHVIPLKKALDEFGSKRTA
ncbi:MAG: carboxymuconolactone decarboxylase family protein [Thermoplasmataceae archaeon]